MVCESWKAQLDRYVDGELSADQMRAFDAHVRNCAACSADALSRVQLKRAIHTAGKRFAPSAEFRQRMQQSITAKPKRILNLGWIFATAAMAVLAITAFLFSYVGGRSGREHLYSEIADLHVATLASSAPADVVSTDRHTVKPWFQGKIPFAFDLPELQNSGFVLLGGRMAYLEQTPGAQLIYDIRKHHISVFVFQERSLPTRLQSISRSSKEVSFNLETWSQNGLRYFVIGDANTADIESLAKLFKAG